jgi:hypothetical protein
MQSASKVSEMPQSDIQVLGKSADAVNHTDARGLNPTPGRLETTAPMVSAFAGRLDENLS